MGNASTFYVDLGEMGKKLSKPFIKFVINDAPVRNKECEIPSSEDNKEELHRLYSTVNKEKYRKCTYSTNKSISLLTAYLVVPKISLTMRWRLSIKRAY